MSDVVRAAADRVNRLLDELMRSVDELTRHADVIRDETRKYVDFKSNPDEYPFTHYLETIEYGLEQADSQLQDVLRHAEDATVHADRLLG